MAKKDKKTNFEKSEIAIKYNIRISQPYLYFPEDVDKVLTEITKQLESITKENESLVKQRDTAEKNLSKLQSQYSELQLQMSLLQVDDPFYTETKKSPKFTINKKP